MRQRSRSSRSFALVGRTVLLALSVFAFAVAASGCTATTPQTTAPPPAPAPEVAPPAAATPPEMPVGVVPKGTVKTLVIKDVEKGTGPAVKKGDSATVDYTGWLTDGTRFDSSIGRQPIPFTVGAGEVIAGWDNGLVGMQAGGKRILVIPSGMAYGPQGRPPVIPQNAVLVFEVDLISIN